MFSTQKLIIQSFFNNRILYVFLEFQNLLRLFLTNIQQMVYQKQRMKKLLSRKTIAKSELENLIRKILVKNIDVFCPHLPTKRRKLNSKFLVDCTFDLVTNWNFFWWQISYVNFERSILKIITFIIVGFFKIIRKKLM